MILPIIMAGGSGSRLWPLSRRLMPKQFLKISSDNTMIQESVLRLAGLQVTPPLTICNEEHRFNVAEQLRENLIKTENCIKNVERFSELRFEKDLKTYINGKINEWDR